MKKVICILLCFILVCEAGCVMAASSQTVAAEDWKLIKDKWREYLVGDETNDFNDEYMKQIIKGIDDKCANAWGLMNKETQILALFGTTPCQVTNDMTKQFVQLENMAMAYGTFGSDYYHNEKLKEDILFAFEWLYENLYGEDEINGTGWHSTSGYDWWDWYVGSLHPLANSLLIMEEHLTPQKIEEYLSIYNYLRGVMCLTDDTAASRIYGGTLTALLEEDEERMNAMQDDYILILKQVNSGNGVQEDWLYLTHHYFPYTTLYGSTALLDRMVVVACILADTCFEITTPHINNIYMWACETFSPVLFDGRGTMALRGRLRDNEVIPAREIIRGLLRCIGIFESEKDLKIKQIIKRNVNDYNISKIYAVLNLKEAETLTQILNDEAVLPEQIKRSKIYYTGDSVMHHMDNERGFALQMSSSRIAGWESTNGKNGNGWYEGSGMLYTYVKDDPECYSTNFWNNVNMYHLPGTTVDTQERVDTYISNSAKALKKNDFAGGAGFDDLYSASAMQLIGWSYDKEEELSSDASGGGAPLHNSTLKGKKAWFMFDDEVVALGSDINANDGFDVHTVVENRLLKNNDVDITVDGTLLEKSETYTKEFTNPTYLHVDGVSGYIFPDGGSIAVEKVLNNKPFFEAWFQHGVSPQKQKYSYISLPSKSAEETENYAKSPDVDILSNNEKLQAVREKTLGVTGMIFWEAGNFKNVSVSDSMIVMMGENSNAVCEVSLSDPTQLLKSSQIKISGDYSLISADDRMTVTEEADGITVDINFENSRGRTLTLMLTSNADEPIEKLATNTFTMDFEHCGNFCSENTMDTFADDTMLLTVPNKETGRPVLKKTEENLDSFNGDVSNNNYLCAELANSAATGNGLFFIEPYGENAPKFPGSEKYGFVFRDENGDLISDSSKMYFSFDFFSNTTSPFLAEICWVGKDGVSGCGTEGFLFYSNGRVATNGSTGSFLTYVQPVIITSGEAAHIDLLVDFTTGESRYYLNGKLYGKREYSSGTVLTTKNFVNKEFLQNAYGVRIKFRNAENKSESESFNIDNIRCMMFPSDVSMTSLSNSVSQFIKLENGVMKFKASPSEFVNDKNKSVTIIIATFLKNGSLLKVVSKDFTVSTMTENIEFSEEITGDYEVCKVMIWDSLQSLKPLMEEESFLSKNKS